MQGYLADRSPLQRRIARIDGTLFREVSFGWGIFGHLDKGGHFRVQQADVGDGSWEITAMDLKITGKILMFKSISMISDETLSDFRRVPDTLYICEGRRNAKGRAREIGASPRPGTSGRNRKFS